MTETNFESAVAAKLLPIAEADADTAAAATADELVVDDGAAGGTETGTAAADAAQTTPPAGEDDEQLIYGKYKTVEEAERALAHLESKLGEQGQELGQTRQEVEQLRQRMEQANQPRYDSDRLEEWLDENAHLVPQVAEQARTHGDGALFDAAMEKWYEVAPRQAAQYERAIEMQQLRSELGTTAAELTAPAQALQVREAQQSAVSNLRGKFEDFAEVMGGMEEAAIGEILSDPLFPSELLSQMNPGDVAAQEKLLGTLYAFAKTRQVGPLSTAAADAARTAADESRDAKRQGTLPSPSGSGTQETAPDPARALKQAFRENFGLPPLEG